MLRRIPSFARAVVAKNRIDDYAKGGGPGEVWLLCSFYHESLRTWIKTIVSKFAISNRTALILRVHALRSYLKLICECELHSLPNKKLVAQGIMVKTTSGSDRPWSAIFCVIVYPVHQRENPHTTSCTCNLPKNYRFFLMTDLSMSKKWGRLNEKTGSG